MNYCIYLRKSRADLEAESRGEGETLIRHERALLDFAKRQNLTIHTIYREIVSGETIAARPVMQQLLAEVEQGLWAGVLVMEVERLARGDTIDQGLMTQTFKYSNTKIITPLKTYDPNNEFDEEYFEFGLFMSRREYKTINRRLQRGRLASVKEGKYVGNRPPYGYTRVKLKNDKGYTLEPHPEQSKVVQLIYMLYTKGEQQKDGSYKRLGLSLITHRLNEMHITPQKGDVWTYNSIRDMLKNPVYRGKIRWNARPHHKKFYNGTMVKERPRAKDEDVLLVDGLHESIIDDATWHLAQTYLSNNMTRPIAGDKSLKNPLAGLILCGQCGHKMVRRPHKHQSATLMCRLSTCTNVSSYLIHIENRLIEALKDWLEAYKFNWQTEEPALSNNTLIREIKDTGIKHLDKEIETTQKQLDSLHNLLEQGVYSTDTFLNRFKLLTDNLQQLRSNRNHLLTRIEFESAKENDNRKAMILKIEKVLDAYPQTDNPEKKNALLKEVLDKVVYTKGVKGRWHHPPDDFELVIFPKLPSLSTTDTLLEPKN